MKILLAEDNEINQKVAAFMLEQAGHQVHAVVNGVEALAAMSGQKFDAVLMDMQMPEMDGLEAARAIRMMEGEAAHTPIIALTASGNLEDIQACMAAGMNHFVSKPLKLAQINAILDQLAKESN
jgi:CheY-like chemotaxis protein